MLNNPHGKQRNKINQTQINIESNPISKQGNKIINPKLPKTKQTPTQESKEDPIPPTDAVHTHLDLNAGLFGAGWFAGCQKNILRITIVYSLPKQLN